jgi:predicted transcriptional regulator
MPELKFDHPVPELTDEEDDDTLAAIDHGLKDAEEGNTVTLEEARAYIQECLLKFSSPKPR